MSLWKRNILLIAASMISLFLVGAAAQDAAKGDVAKGKQVFEDNCQICHNADSAEDKVGPGLKGLMKKPPHKMADGTEHKQHTVEMIRKQVKEGSSAMPPVGASLSDKEMDDLMAFLTSL